MTKEKATELVQQLEAVGFKVTTASIVQKRFYTQIEYVVRIERFELETENMTAAERKALDVIVVNFNERNNGIMGLSANTEILRNESNKTYIELEVKINKKRCLSYIIKELDDCYRKLNSCIPLLKEVKNRERLNVKEVYDLISNKTLLEEQSEREAEHKDLRYKKFTYFGTEVILKDLEVSKDKRRVLVERVLEPCLNIEYEIEDHVF